MKLLNKIRSWPLEKKRTFSILAAVFFTVLIIILNSALNLIWKNEEKNRAVDKNNPINTIQETFSKIINESKPALDEALSSSTTEKIIDQINSASSSFSTTSNIVE